MKGEVHPAWKIHNSEDCESKKYYKKRMYDSSDSPSTDYKRSKKGDYKKAYAFK